MRCASDARAVFHAASFGYRAARFHLYLSGMSRRSLPPPGTAVSAEAAMLTIENRATRGFLMASPALRRCPHSANPPAAPWVRPLPRLIEAPRGHLRVL